MRSQSFPKLPIFVFSAIPTTVRQGLVRSLVFTHWPMASWFGHRPRAIDSLTTTTSGAPARSSSVKLRPRMIRVPVVAK